MANNKGFLLTIRRRCASNYHSVVRLIANITLIGLVNLIQLVTVA